MAQEWIELTRDCEAVLVPAGTTVLLRGGTRAVVTQALGGSYTLHVPDYGGLVRISDRDADAVGLEPPVEAAHPVAPAEGDLDPGTLETLVWQQLRSCYDPEIPVTIVDLGLVYDMTISPAGTEHHRVDIKMTLTAPGCGMGASIAADARHKILSLPNIEEADVELVWQPQWNPNMISPAGRAKLGMD